MPFETLKQQRLPVVAAPRLGDVPAAYQEEPPPKGNPWDSPLRPPKHPKIGFNRNISAGDIERLLGLA